MAFLTTSLKHELIQHAAEGIYTGNFVKAASIPFGFFSDNL